MNLIVHSVAEAVKVTSPTTTDLEIEVAVANCLHNAADRQGGRAKRRKR